MFEFLPCWIFPLLLSSWNIENIHDSSNTLFHVLHLHGTQTYTAVHPSGLTWLLVYRTEKYQKLKAEVERQCKRCEWSLLLSVWCWHTQEHKIREAYPHPYIFLVHVCVVTVEKKKEAHGDSIDRQQKRKIEREEERLKNSNRDLSLVKMKSMFAIGFAFTALLSMFNSM